MKSNPSRLLLPCAALCAWGLTSPHECSAATSLMDGLVVHLPLDGDATDKSGKGNNATTKGNVLFVNGVIGKAASLSGSSFPIGHILFGPRTDLLFGDSTDFTLSLWFRPDSSSGAWPLLFSVDSDAPVQQGIGLVGFADSGSGLFVVGLRPQSKSAVPLGQNSLSSWTSGAWRHIALTAQRGNIARMYLDGVEIASASLAGRDGNLDPLPGQGFTIGQDSAGNASDIASGSYDDLGIWRRALSAAEVSSIHQAGLSGHSFDEAVAPVVSTGDLDAHFDPGLGPNSGPVYKLLYQFDGKLIVVGKFTSFDGSSRPGIVRLHPDGTVDESFQPRLGFGSDDFINAVAVQPDGKLVVGGYFNLDSFSDGIDARGIARLNTDGSLDKSFQPPQLKGGGSDNPVILDVAVQADGKILIGGDLGRADNITISHVIRLKSNGTLDTRFAPVITRRDIIVPVSRVVPTRSGIMVFGSFNQVNGQKRFSHARLNLDGSLDMNYSASGDGPELPSIFGGRTSGRVNDGLVLPDGSVLLGGDFGTVGGQNCKAIAAFSPEGVWLPNFAPVLAGGLFATPEVKGFAMTQGGVLVAGNFDTIGGRNVGHIAKLGLDGKVDPSFTTALVDDTRAVAVRCDGMVAVGGVFNFIKGVRRSGVSQFHSTAPTAIRMVAPAMLPNGQSVVRCGVVPGKRYTVEGSNDLIHWSTLKTSVPTYSLELWIDPAAASNPARFYRALEK